MNLTKSGKKFQKCNSHNVLMSERHNFSIMLYTQYNGLYLTRSLSQAKKKLKFNIQKTDKWKFFGVLTMNGIENYPAAGEIFLENVILKVSQTHFSKDFYPKGGHTFFKGGHPGHCEVFVRCHAQLLHCKWVSVYISITPNQSLL